MTSTPYINKNKSSSDIVNIHESVRFADLVRRDKRKYDAWLDAYEADKAFGDVFTPLVIASFAFLGLCVFLVWIFTL
jgi:hypothetical protein